MSDAKVQFLRINGEPCPLDEPPQRFTFACVKYTKGPLASEGITCGMLLIANAGHGIKRDGNGANGGRPQWDWNGSRVAPTFSPSVNCEKHCGWHGYVRNGRTVSTNGSDEP